MSQIKELKQWLNEHYNTFPETLQFAMKIMQSPEFPISAKYDTVFQYFCEKLPEYRKSLVDNEQELNKSWEVVNQFLSIKFPSTAISITTQEKVLEILCHVTTKTKDCPSNNILESLVIIINHSGYKKFFKGNLSVYASMIGHVFKYASLLKTLDKQMLDKVLDDLRNYVKSARINTEFRQIFYDTILEPFVTFVNAQETQSYRSDLLNFLQQLYFIEENLELYTKVIEGEDVPDLVNTFDTKHASKETFLIIIESFFKAYKCVNASFLEFLFDRLYNPALETLSVKDCLDSIINVVRYLKKYEIKIRKQEVVDEVDMIEYLREKMENICTEYYEEQTSKVLELVVTTISYNPLIMERRSFSVLVNCMFVTKESKEVTELYERFVKTIIRMTNDLRRGEYFVVYLIKAVREKLDSYQIPKRLKRKALTDGKASVKRHKQNSGALNESLCLDSTFEAGGQKPYGLKFKEIFYAWPYEATEEEFSHLISLLTSRQMMTTWRLLTEFLKEELSSLETLSENKLFLIDLLSCLLCQFLANNQLAEQSHLYWDVIIERCLIMKDLLKTFGKTLLHMEHNRRLINAFLSISYEFSSFESLLWYYSPDSIATDKTLIEQYPDLPELDLKKKSKSLFDYLDQDEWQLIEQRIKNFGKFECCYNIGLIHLQKVHAALLFEGHKGFKRNWTSLVDLVMSDDKMITVLLNDDAVNGWFVSHLNKKQMQKVSEILLNAPDKQRIHFLKKDLMETPEMANIVSLMAFKHICETNGSVLADIDFVEILEMNVSYVASQISAALVKQTSGVTHDSQAIETLYHLPLGNVSKECKTIIFGLLLALLTDLSRTETQVEEQKKIIGCLTVLLHFPDDFPDIFQYYTIDILLQTFNEGHMELLNDIFNQSIFYMTDVTYETIKKFVKRLKKDESKEVLNICTVILKCLSTVHYIKNKKFTKEELEKLEYKYADAIFTHITANISHDSDDLTKTEKKFIKNTSESFQVLLKSYIGRKNKTDDQVEEHNKLLQKYLKAMGTNTESTTNLSVLILENKSKFQLEPEQISTLVEGLWKKFEQILAHTTIEQGSSLERTKKNIVSLIFTLKTKEELETILTELETSVKTTPTNFETVIHACRILQEISEHGISKSKTSDALEKNNIFGIHSRQILTHIISHKLEGEDLTSQERVPLVKEILKAQTLICTNIRVPISSEMVNDCINFMLKINLKSLKVENENVTIFVDLHKLMAELMFILVTRRSDQTMNYLPSLLLIFKDLLLVISLYRSDRPLDETLNNSEISLLADLTHKIEKITNQLIKHDRALKLVTPFLITSVIETMTASKRSTTLHEKVKNIFKNICYSLIDKTDHHHHKFILRSSEEATRDIYNLLYKEYQKFRAFRGKV